MRRNGREFRLFEQVKDESGKTCNCTVTDPRIDAVNLLFTKKEINEETARQRLKDIRRSIYISQGKELPRGNTDNLKVLDLFWHQYRKRHRNLVDAKGALRIFQRAIELLGPLNISTCTEYEIQDRLDKAFTGHSNHQKIGGALKSLLRFAKRHDVHLIIDAPKKKEISFLTEEQVIKLADSIKHENLKNLVLSAFYTGMRVGELFYLAEGSIDGRTITVNKQKKRTGEVTQTKTGIERKAVALSNTVAILNWARGDKILPMRQENISHFIRRQSKKVLGKSIKFHDLRHSYAVYLIQKGAPIELVAQSMGNSVKICERHYSGFQITNVGIETLKRILG